jgi:tetratricopeptide (TPR) repeat protein
MSSDISRFISKAKELWRSGSPQAAISLANELVQKYPTEIRTWLLRAHLYNLNENHKEAIADLTHAININDMEPHLFYTRGTCSFALADYESALNDFSKGLQLCDYHNNDYYRGELHFWRAETLLKLGRKRDALADLVYVDEDHTSWTDKLRTKADLLKDCDLPG